MLHTYRYKINYTYIGGSSSNSSSNENENPLLLTNVDDNGNHIRPAVQNIVLLYGPDDPEFVVIKVGQAIATQVYDPTKGTQSERWCPLIWQALSRCRNDVPKRLTQIDKELADFLEDSVVRLSQLPGWCDYAYRVLINNFGEIPEGSNDFESKFVTEQSEKFANEKA